MSYPVIWALFLMILRASAFSDSSPFFFVSSARFSTFDQASHQLISASSLSSKLQHELADCQSDTYVLITQPHVSSTDFQSYDAAPHLRDLLKGNGNRERSSYNASEVVGTLDVDNLQNFLESKCQASLLHLDASTSLFEKIDDMNPRVIKVDFEPLPTQQPARQTKLLEHDAFLSSIVDMLPSDKYTIIYSTSAPSGDASGGKEHQRGVHAELKRDTDFDEPEDEDHPRNSSVPDDAPLFEKYQFLTPGLFMGILVSVVLFAILSIGVTAISSLQVSYAAFDKDMGPSALKKQQ